MRRENFSMSAVIIQNERPTTRSYLSKSEGWACLWAMERLASYSNQHCLRSIARRLISQGDTNDCEHDVVVVTASVDVVGPLQVEWQQRRVVRVVIVGY